MHALRPRLPLPTSSLPSRRIDLVLIGARGQVGTALRHRLATQQATLAAHTGLDLRLLAAFDRRGLAWDLHGLDPVSLDARLQPRREDDIDALFAGLMGRRAAPAIVVDCTASDAIAAQYPAWLAAGLGVVTANKRANARELAFYRELQRASAATGAPYRFETTVGAATPILGPLRDLALRGERVQSIQGVLSGSLSFLLERLHGGQGLRDALSEAQRLGYTEPDPGDDLRAEDLVRKLLVLAREAGFPVEATDVEVTPFCAAAREHPAAWAAHLADEEVLWATRIRAAKAAGCRWAILAEIDAEGARIALRLLDAASPFATLPAGQNLVRIETDLQGERPLWLGGPGAGPDITAAGVLSDVIAAATTLAGGGYAESRRRRVAA